MPAIIRDRMTVELEKPAVLFLVGGQVYNPLAIRRILFLSRAFREMVSWLRDHPESGFVSGNLHLLAPSGMTLISYWKSFEDVERFARQNDAPHLPAWSRFAKTIGKDGSVGIWHETYQIEPAHRREVVYIGMAPFGLGSIGKLVPTHTRQTNARGRWSPDDTTVSEEEVYPLK